MFQIVKKGYMYFAIGAFGLVLLLFISDGISGYSKSKSIKSGSVAGSITGSITGILGKNSPAMLLLVGGIIGYGISYMKKDDIEGCNTCDEHD
jgi:hypothetical protein